MKNEIHASKTHHFGQNFAFSFLEGGMVVKTWECGFLDVRGTVNLKKFYIVVSQDVY